MAALVSAGRRRAGRAVLAACCLGLIAALAAGCVQRRLIVRSNPPGARVIVDDTYEMGVTPVAFNYTYYGTRKIKLVRDGYETMTVYQYIPPPWYQYPVLDFITENLIPWEIRDERVVQFQMVPQAVVPTEQVLRRAEQLRRSAHGGRLPAPMGAGVAGQSQGAGTAVPGSPAPAGSPSGGRPAVPGAFPPPSGSGQVPGAVAPGFGAPGAGTSPAVPQPQGQQPGAPNPYLPPGGFAPPPAARPGN